MNESSEQELREFVRLKHHSHGEKSTLWLIFFVSGPFGLARHEKAGWIDIRWPSGQIDRLQNIAPGQTIVVIEGKGVSERRSYTKR